MLMPANIAAPTGTSAATEDRQHAATASMSSKHQHPQQTQPVSSQKMTATSSTPQHTVAAFAGQVNAAATEPNAADPKTHKTEGAQNLPARSGTGEGPATGVAVPGVGRGGPGAGMTNLQTGVEGLTFGDDWRDPFMGFFQGTE